MKRIKKVAKQYESLKKNKGAKKQRGQVFILDKQHDKRLVRFASHYSCI